MKKQERKGYESYKRKRKLRKFTVPQIQVKVKTQESKEEIYDNYSKPMTAAKENELALTSESPIRHEKEGKR